MDTLKHCTAFFSVLFVLFFTQFAFGQDSGYHHSCAKRTCYHKEKCHSLPLCSPLRFNGITKGQRQTLRYMHARYMQKIMPYKAELKEKQALVNTIIAGDQNKAKLNGLIKDISELKEEIMEKRINHIQAVRNHLPDHARVYFDQQILNGSIFNESYDTRIHSER